MPGTGEVQPHDLLTSECQNSDVPKCSRDDAAMAPQLLPAQSLEVRSPPFPSLVGGCGRHMQNSPLFNPPDLSRFPLPAAKYNIVTRMLNFDACTPKIYILKTVVLSSRGSRIPQCGHHTASRTLCFSSAYQTGSPQGRGDVSPGDPSCLCWS